MPFYWHGVEWVIWIKPPLRVTCEWPYIVCSFVWKWWLWKYESVIKLLWMLGTIQLNEKCHNDIYHIFIYSWHTVTLTWLIMVFLQISHTPRHTYVSVKGSKREIWFYTDCIIHYVIFLAHPMVTKGTYQVLPSLGLRILTVNIYILISSHTTALNLAKVRVNHP